MRWTIEQRGDRWAVVNLDAGMTDTAHWRSEDAANARALTLNAPLVAAGLATMTCPTCEGSGQMDGETCPTCDGSGEVQGNAAASVDRGAAFYAVLAIDDWMTEDGRYVETFDWADGILPFMALTENQGGGHWGAELAGRIESIEKMGDGRRVFATGTFDPTEIGATTETQVRAQSLRFVSVDPAAVEYVEVITKVDTDGWPLDGYVRFTSYTIGGATACPFPAIRMATVWCDGMDAPGELSEPLPDPVPVGVPVVEGVTEGDVVVIIAGADLPAAERGVLIADPEQRALLAAATPALTAAAAVCELTTGCGGPAVPPRAFFDDPRLDGPTPLVVERDGRVYGHLALWNVQHRGFLNYQAGNVFAPRNNSDYSQFHVHTTFVACCDDPDCGHDRETIRTGVLTLGTSHADKRARSIGAVLAHYENTGLAAADVRVGEDAHGIWIAGALRPNMADDRVRELLGSSPSGDWRGISGALELCAVLMVNVGGFPIVASAFEDHGEVVTLIAGFASAPVEDTDALVASLGVGRGRRFNWPVRDVEGFNAGVLSGMVDAALNRRLGPIERDLALLAPLTAEAQAARIADMVLTAG